MKWTKEKRDALDADSFGDPARKLFPVEDQEDLDSAARLVGKAKDPEKVKARLIAIARRLKLTIPAAWQAKSAMSETLHDVAAFDLGSPVEDGEWVEYPDSLLFRAGEYEQKSYSMTPEELWAAAEQFEPVPNELEHVNTEGTATILDGKLGGVEAVRLSDDGQELRGTVKIPRWLDAIWDAPAKRVSCVWDRGTKTLSGLGLVVKGHVPDAALMAAFAESAAFTPRKTTPESTAHMQAIHDHVATLAPDLCAAAMGDVPEQRKAYGKIHRLAVEHGATCPGAAAMSAAGNARRTTMSMVEKFRALFGDKAEAPEAPEVTEEQAALIVEAIKPAEEPAPKVEAPASFADSPEARAMQRQIDELRARDEAGRKAAVAKDAARFADDAVRAGRVPSKLKASFARLIVRCAEDDHAAPAKVTFTDARTAAEAEGTRLDALMAFAAELPPAFHAESVFDPAKGLLDDYSALFNEDAARPATDEERRRAILSRTDTGRQILAAEKK